MRSSRGWSRSVRWKVPSRHKGPSKNDLQPLERVAIARLISESE